jgi:ABC-2 type transport system permease protein
MTLALLRLALRAEWTKTRTVASTAWLLAGVIAATVAVGAAVVASARCAGAGAGAGCGEDPGKTALAGVDLGQAVVAVLAVLAIGNEYGTGMIRVTLAALPHRTSVLAAKAATLTAGVLAAGTVAVLGSVLAGRLISPGFIVLDAALLRAVIGSVLYLVLIGLLSLGIATIVRDAGLAIGLVLGLLYLFPIAAQVVSDITWRQHLEQIGPMTAGLAVQDTMNLAAQPIGPWAGLGVLAAWAAGVLLLGGLLLVIRDA